MDFFQLQDRARKQTLLLVLLFALAVISLVVLTNLLVMFIFGYIDSQTINSGAALLQFDWQVFFSVSTLVIAVILFGSLYKISALSKGGDAVAEMLDGRLIVAGRGDLDQQKILNVVEEMAIASGTPVPPVYLLDEEGINAFAAGFSPSDAVIGVTRGCIQQLNRAQLQGVIAHEFSHILNGDMRINIRLTGILHGILIIGLIGYFLLRSTAYSRYSRSSRNNGGGAILGLGLGLIIIGFAGTFFGNLIKAAVSRQREFLADASAVQFTRNNMGIANALKRIGGSVVGSRLENPAAAQISHALFAEGVSGFFSSLFASHPPLDKRIRRLDPNWDGSYNVSATEAPDLSSGRHSSHAQSSAAEKLVSGIAAASFATSNVDQIGQVRPEVLQQAQALLQQIPPQLHDAIHEPHGARAAIYFLLLNTETDIRQAQLHYLQAESDDGVFDLLRKLEQETAHIDVAHRLPLIEINLPALRQLSAQQYQRFKNNVRKLVEIDRKVSLFEWSLQKILFHHLDAVFVKIPRQGHKYTSLKQVAAACSLLLSMLLYVGKQKKINEAQVIQAASRELGNINLQLLPRTDISLPALDQALERLNRLTPLLKPRLLKACVICIKADNHFSTVEAELFRAIADTLDCPMPPVQL
ncbi:MAG TPA: heat-shock protein HtpX [Gammaproteobacteria bacterium]|nr:heat-shock protein HtpX [Gammaproteobacteria bacterium]